MYNLYKKLIIIFYRMWVKINPKLIISHYHTENWEAYQKQKAN